MSQNFKGIPVTVIVVQPAKRDYVHVQKQLAPKVAYQVFSGRPLRDEEMRRAINWFESFRAIERGRREREASSALAVGALDEDTWRAHFMGTFPMTPPAGEPNANRRALSERVGRHLRPGEFFDDVDREKLCGGSTAFLAFRSALSSRSRQRAFTCTPVTARAIAGSSWPATTNRSCPSSCSSKARCTTAHRQTQRMAGVLSSRAT